MTPEKTKAGWRRYRSFGGRRFAIQGSTSVKRLADDRAEGLRQEGYMARVVKRKRPKVYLIYARKR